MPRPPRIHIPGLIHHVMARGNGGQEIFTDSGDWNELLKIFNRVKSTSDFRIFAYCLMPNHFHLLVEVGNDPLSHIMHRIQSTWAKRFNLARSRKGHLFQNRFKSLQCDNDDYFRWLLRYIHLNPVKAGLAERPEEWPWSSFRQYMGIEGGIADTEWPLSLFNPHPIESFRQFVLQGIDDDDAKPLELDDSRTPQLLKKDREHYSAVTSINIDQFASRYAAENDVDIYMFLGPSRARNICLKRRQFSVLALSIGHRNQELARLFGISTTAVTKMVRKAATGILLKKYTCQTKSSIS